jgi:hypothetical protein
MRTILVINGAKLTVDAPEVSLALSPSKDRDRAVGALDLGNHRVYWMISAGSVSLKEVME